MGKKRLLFILIGIGILLIIGGWFFVYNSLKKNPQDLEANIHPQNEIKQQDVASPKKDNIKLPEQKDQQKEKEIDASLDEAIENNVEQFATITIIVPPHIDSKGLQQLRKEIYKTHKVLGEFEQYKTFQAYQEAIENQLQHPSADLILISSNWIDSYKGRGAYIPSKQPLSQLFHIAVKELVESPVVTFIPFSIDPYITIYNQDLNLPTRITIGNIQQQLLPLTVKENFPLPISFGITDQDLFLLEQEKQSYPEYVDILQIIIEQAAYTRNTYGIEYFLQALGRNTKTLLLTSRQQKNQEPACMTFPHICLLQKQKTAISFGRFSSLALGESLFNREYEKTHKIANFPADKKHYPVTSRGFIINKNTTHPKSVISRMRGYLEHAGYSNIPLWSYTLSAFNHVYQQQKMQTPWVELLDNIQNMYIVQGSIDILQQIAKNTKLQAMLAGEYSKIIYIQEYLQQTSE